jgi:[histone H3]-lysine36 N-trimethyltransferase
MISRSMLKTYAPCSSLRQERFADLRFFVS